MSKAHESLYSDKHILFPRTNISAWRNLFESYYNNKATATMASDTPPPDTEPSQKPVAYQTSTAPETSPPSPNIQTTTSHPNSSPTRAVTPASSASELDIDEITRRMKSADVKDESSNEEDIEPSALKRKLSVDPSPDNPRMDKKTKNGGRPLTIPGATAYQYSRLLKS
ncbi:uncharacterized protein PAC_17027 [Phialocephala subalpina]|uniref:Uncharacterized protein n=1 Tax=Phialocephala subalpina TaxID=576137 RepID=A0A1L7XQ91_9HELO|nr:uncharacterized protein PAC_17027 [Phialocephala subalpina]